MVATIEIDFRWKKITKVNLTYRIDGNASDIAHLHKSIVCSPMLAFSCECNVLVWDGRRCWSFFYFLEHCQPNIINHLSREYLSKFFTFWIKLVDSSVLDYTTHYPLDLERKRESLCVMRIHRANRNQWASKLSTTLHIVFHFEKKEHIDLVSFNNDFSIESTTSSKNKSRFNQQKLTI